MRTPRSFLAPLAAALLLRLCLLAITGGVMEPDSFAYENLGNNVAAGRGYTDTRPFSIGDAALMRTPLYPMFIAATYRGLGRHIAAVAVAQQILAVAAIGLLSAVASAIFGTSVARGTAWVLALHPWLAAYGNAIMTETVFAFLVAVSVWLLVVAVRKGGVVPWFACGAALGLSVLCRPTMLAALPALPALALLATRPRWKLVGRAALAWLSVAVVVGPWIARNFVRYSYLGIAPITGTVLLMRVNPEAAQLDPQDKCAAAVQTACLQPEQSVLSLVPESPEYRANLRSGSARVPCVYAALRTLLHEGHTLPEVDGAFLRLAVKQIRARPLHYLAGGLYQAAFLWSGYPTEWLGGAFDRRVRDNFREGDRGVWAVKFGARVILGVALAFLTLLGAFFAFRARISLALIPASLLVYITCLTAALNVAELRFRLPFEPFAVMFGVYGVLRLHQLGTIRSAPA